VPDWQPDGTSAWNLQQQADADCPPQLRTGYRFRIYFSDKAIIL